MTDDAPSAAPQESPPTPDPVPVATTEVTPIQEPIATPPAIEPSAEVSLPQESEASPQQTTAATIPPAAVEAVSIGIAGAITKVIMGAEANPENVQAEPVHESSPVNPQPVSVNSAARVDLRQYNEKAKESLRRIKRDKLDKIMSHVREHKRISNDGTQLLLRVSDSTAQRYLHQLVVEGRLERIEKGSEFEYVTRAGGQSPGV